MVRRRFSLPGLDIDFHGRTTKSFLIKISIAPRFLPKHQSFSFVHSSGGALYDWSLP